MEGLSPFLMLDLSEDEVAAINDEADLLRDASLVSLKDLRQYRQKMKVCIPATADNFLLLLKRYANLLFALFSEDSSFFQCINQLITAGLFPGSTPLYVPSYQGLYPLDCPPSSKAVWHGRSHHFT